MKPKCPRRLAMFAAIASAAMAGSCVAPRSTPPPSPRTAGPPETSDSSEQPVVAHNARRAKAGLPPLVVNPLLEAAAAGHARDMADRRRMSHRGGDGSSPFDRIDRQGYRYRSAAENVAYGFADVESVMAGWLRSPGHRRNILGKYSEIGVGRAVDKGGVAYWSVTFGTPRTVESAGSGRVVGYASVEASRSVPSEGGLAPERTG